MSNESENIFVSSRGIMKSCDYYSLTPISSIKQLYNYPDFYNFINNCKNNSVIPKIYICSSALIQFSKIMLPQINFKFILLSGDCDEDIPNEIFRTEKEFNLFVNNNNLVHWYCQNWVGNHEKVTLIPIGMDYHTMQSKTIFWGPKTNAKDQELLLMKIRNKMKPFWEREVKCYSNFHFTTNTKHGYDRIDAIKNIKEDLIYYEPKKIIRFASWNKQTNYAFVISPHGGGYDCHRTWEALLLGCIVIVKSSKLDNLYDNLPVLIVNNWSDITVELLNNTIKTFRNKTFNYDKLTLQYWIDQISTCNNI